MHIKAYLQKTTFGIRTCPRIRNGNGKYFKIMKLINKYHIAFINIFLHSRNMFQLMERENAGQQKLGVTITLMNPDALEAQTSTSGVALGTAQRE